MKYSTVLSKVKINNGYLVIRQRRTLALIIVIAFLALCCFAMTKPMPMILKVNCSLGIAILIWAVYDISTSSFYFKYHIDSARGFIRAKKGKSRIKKTFRNDQNLEVISKRSPSTDSIDTYQILLRIRVGEIETSLPLETFDVSLEMAEMKIEEWKIKLGL